MALLSLPEGLPCDGAIEYDLIFCGTEVNMGADRADPNRAERTPATP